MRSYSDKKILKKLLIIGTTLATRSKNTGTTKKLLQLSKKYTKLTTPAIDSLNSDLSRVVNRKNSIKNQANELAHDKYFCHKRKVEMELDGLALEQGNASRSRAARTEEEQTSLIIKSLRDNYFAYGAAKSRREIRDNKIDHHFHTVYRIMPAMKEDSRYKQSWDTFVQAACAFFDCDTNKDIIAEILKLEKKFKTDSAKSPNKSPEKILEEIVGEFEKEAGFADLTKITQADGILSATAFLKIVAEGHPFNDYGPATPQHGVYSHRIQFYLLGNYIKNNLEKFFPTQDVAKLMRELAKQYPEVRGNDGQFTVNQVVSVFYRLLGNWEFQNSFDWDKFTHDVQTRSKKDNPNKTFPMTLNNPYIWTQVVDRFSYAGYFSVPSNFGFVQALGCFSTLPKIGLPYTQGDKNLKTILDVTPKFIKQEPSKKNQVNELAHDEFFNNKRKAEYETYLSQLFMTHLAPFMRVIKKVSDIIVEDIKKMLIELKSNKNSISKKMITYFSNDPDLQVLFGEDITNKILFCEKLIQTLKSNRDENFYKHMCIQRSYITFFTEKGKAKPEMDQAIKEKWTVYVKLDKLLHDVRKFRQDDIFFKNNLRLERHHIPYKVTKDIGIMPPDNYNNLLINDRLKLRERLPVHTAGILLFMMTTNGGFTSSGMLDYDMPQAAGPSGNTAMRLALANQARLDKSEKELFAFAVALYHVAIGAHTVDECFMIANVANFANYIRGSYISIIPKSIKNDIEFCQLLLDIQALNNNYHDILWTSQHASITPDTPSQNETICSLDLPGRVAMRS